MALLTTAEVGRLRHASALTLGVAGAESNVAIGARRLGCPAAWVGRVGDDELGELVVSRIRAEGVDVEGVVRDPEAPTSLMLKERRTADMVRVLYYRRHGPGSRLRPDDLDPAQVAAAGVLHVTGITPALSDSARATVDHAVELARAAGVPVSFDLNYRSALWPPDRAAAVCRDLAARADIVFAGDDEAELLGLDGRAVAFALYMQLAGRAYGLNMAFDPAYAPYGPGSEAKLQAIEASWSEGVRRIELLGTAAEHKRRFSDRFEPVYEGVGLARTRRGRAATEALLAGIRVRRAFKRSKTARKLYAHMRLQRA
jgi:hypothetical protein